MRRLFVWLHLSNGELSLKNTGDGVCVCGGGGAWGVAAGGGGADKMPGGSTLLPPEIFCIKMGSNESRFNVSVIVKDVTRQCPHTHTYTHTPKKKLFEGKGEPKRSRTEVLLLTSLTPYRYAIGQTGSQRCDVCFFKPFITVKATISKRVWCHGLLQVLLYVLRDHKDC